MLRLFVILLALPTAFSLNCTGRSDGNYEISCRSYSSCTKGVFNTVSCKDDRVYNDKTNKCDDPVNVSPPCGQQIDCSTKKDGHFADTANNCDSYYTCASGSFFGHNICPKGTVFDHTMQTCNWPQNVDPPCGTKTKASPSP